MKRKYAFIVILALLAVIYWQSRTHTIASNDGIRHSRDCSLAWHKEYFSQAKIVFSGIVTHQNRQNVAITLEKAWKGKLAASGVILSYATSQSSLRQFTIGKTYIFFLTDSAEQPYKIDYCDYVIPVNENPEVLKYLDSLEANQ